MRVLVVGDVHWSEYSSIVRKRGEVYSKRLENLINSINWVESVAEENNVDRVVFLGDFFDKSTLNATEISALKEVVWANIPHDFIVGNHEGLSEDLELNSTNIMTLVPNCRVIDRPMFDCGYGYRFLYLPYSLEENRKSIGYWLSYFTGGQFFTQEVKQTIVFSHNDVKMKFGLLESSIGYGIDDIDNNCDLFLNGHIHSGGKFSRVGYNVGNLTGQNFGEDSTKYTHSIVLLDTNDRTFDVFENPYAFNFYKIDVSSLEEVEHFINNVVKDNSIVTIKAIESICEDVRLLLSTNGVAVSKIKEYRVISKHINQDSDTMVDETIIESVNHLDEFVTFIKNNLEITPMIAEELSEVCR